MKSSGSLHLKTFLMILWMVVFGPLGNTLLGKGMKQAGPLAFGSRAEFAQLAVQVFTSGIIWLGIASLMSFFVAYMLVLSWADYSYVQPASSIAYAVVALLGHFVLQETVTATRWIGVAIICLGVLVVGNTPPRTTEGT
jgi:EamA-like transporter family protein